MPVITLIAAVTGAAAFAGGAFIAGSAITVAGILTAAAGAAIAAGLSYLLAERPSVGGGPGQVTSNIGSVASGAHYVFGYARTPGVPIFAETRPDDDRVLDLAFMLSEGSIEDVIGVIINGVYFEPEDLEPGAETFAPGTKRSGVTGPGARWMQMRGPRSMHFNLTVYLDSHTTAICENNGWSLRAVQPTRWLSTMALPVAWCHMSLTEIITGGRTPTYSRIPSVSFVLKGMRIQYPGVSEPTWTRNAAACRYFWETEVLKRQVDEASVREAIAVCGAAVNYGGDITLRDLPEKAPHIRYAMDGVVLATDDADAVEFEMDWAWQGHSVKKEGVWTFRPGVARSPALTIGPSDILEVLDAQYQPELRDRVNTMRGAIRQSIIDDLMPSLALPDHVDIVLQELDGEERFADTGTRVLVGDPYAAQSLLAMSLRRQRSGAKFSVRVVPGAGFKNYGLVPTDVILLTVPEYGALNMRCVVVGVAPQEDHSVVLQLREELQDTYLDRTQRVIAG